VPLRPRPTGPEVASLVRRRLDLEDGAVELLAAHAETAAEVIADLAFDYCRGRGWSADGTECTPAIRGVILLAAARLAHDGTQATYRSEGAIEGTDLAEYSVRGGTWVGWTLAERMTLDAYRRRLGVA